MTRLRYAPLVHSSLIVPGSGVPIAKIGVRGSLGDSRAARKAEVNRQRRVAYAQVDARDHFRCRVCDHQTSKSTPVVRDKTQRHHLRGRGWEGAETSGNIATICQKCHDDIHKRGVLRITGNADHPGALVIEDRVGYSRWHARPEFRLHRPRFDS